MQPERESVSETVKMDESHASFRDGHKIENIGTVEADDIKDAVSDNEDDEDIEDNEMEEEWNEYMKEEEQFENKKEKTKEKDRIAGNLTFGLYFRKCNVSKSYKEKWI
jgi:hypothetical protein